MAHSTTFRRACAAAALGHIAPLQVNVATVGWSRLRIARIDRRAFSGDDYVQVSGGIPVFTRMEFGGVGKKFSRLSRRRAIEGTAKSSKGPEFGGARFDGPSRSKNKNVKVS
jgi:hypothetical protein